MGIEVASSFTRKAPVPLDDLTVVADLTARDAIEAGVRYEGMVCYVVSEAANFQLVGGILNSNWEDFGSGGGGGAGGGIDFYGVDGELTPDDAQIRTLILKAYTPESDVPRVYGRFTVPVGYKSGNLISLKNGKCYANSTDTTKDVAWKADVYLIKPGSALPVPGDYQPEGSPAETTYIGGTVYTALDISAIPLTSVDGEINSVAVAPGDVLCFAIYRDIGGEEAGLFDTVYLDLKSFTVSLKD